MQGISLKTLSDMQIGVLFTKYMPPIVTFILVIVLANNLATMTWLTMPSKPDVPVPADPTRITTTQATNTVNTQGSVANQLANWHLFGVVPKEVPKPQVVAPPPEIPEEAPDTTLQLTLKGVFSSKDMMHAWAIIADRMGNEDSYGIEDELPDNAILKEIFADRIILQHNGRYETLRLPEDDASGVNTRPSRANSRRSSNSRSSPPVSQIPTGSVNHLSYEATQVVKSYKEKLLSDPQSVMNTLRAEPYRQAGQLKGYRIFPGRDKDLFGKVGLEPGDVVTAVNGIELDSPLKGLEVMQNITDAAEVSVNVLRNGVNQTFIVPLN